MTGPQNLSLTHTHHWGPEALKGQLLQCPKVAAEVRNTCLNTYTHIHNINDSVINT